MHRAAQQAVVEQEAELGASLRGVRRRDVPEERLGAVREQREALLEKRRQPLRLLPQGHHSPRELEDLEGRAEARDVENAGVAELEARGAADGLELGFHLEPRPLVIPPPARQPVAEGLLGRLGRAVSRVYECAADAARPAVQILVRAPRCGVHVPVVEREGHVACGVGKVPNDEYAVVVGIRRYRRYVEELAGVVLYSREQD